MPSSRHARITRIAISPRFATRTFLKSLLFIPARSRDRQQRLTRTDDLALFDVNLANLAGDRGDDVVLHLHRLQDGDHVAQLHAVTRADGDLHDESLHRRDHRSLPDLGRSWRSGRGRTRSTGNGRDGHPRPGHSDLEDLPLDLNLEL